MAAVPPKLTAVAPVRLVPVMTTDIVGPAEVGENDVIVGAATHVKPAKVAVPPAVVTNTLPLVPAPTVAVICVALFTV